MRLFAMSRRFNVEIQPQLVLLQKTLLQIEGLGRELDPNLDLWQTGKPYLERWMSEQLGWRGLVKNLRNEAPEWASMLPQIPRLLHGYLARKDSARLDQWHKEWLLHQRRQGRMMFGVFLLFLLLALSQLGKWIK
jgi:ubiquinone biosynthesis protein